MASTRTVLSDQRPDDAANLVRCGLFPALLKASVEDRYHESINYPEHPLDDSDVILEVFLPTSGTHFRNITSFQLPRQYGSPLTLDPDVRTSVSVRKTVTA